MNMKEAILRCHYGVIFDEMDYSFTIKNGQILATTFDIDGVCVLLDDKGDNTVPSIFAKLLSQSIKTPCYLEINREIDYFSFDSVASSNKLDYKANPAILKAIYLVESAMYETLNNPNKTIQIDIDVQNEKITYCDFDKESYMNYIDKNYDFVEVATVKSEVLKRIEAFLNNK